ncbi:MAG: ATP-binding protein [Thermodesulfovibrionales bacterium]
MSIKIKLITAFLAFTIIPMVLLGALVFTNAKKQLQAVRIAQLESIADLKKDKIETFFRERKGNIFSAQNFFNIKQNLPLLNKSARDRSHTLASMEAVNQLDRQIKPFQEAYGYLDIMLTNPQGTVVYASSDTDKKAELGKFLRNRRDYEEGKKDIYFTDVSINKDDSNRYEMFVVAPLHDFKENFIGEVIMEIDMNPIYRFIQDSTGLGKTGEALIVKEEGDDALFLSPLRRDPDAALKKRVPFSEIKGLAAQMAAQGKSGSGFTFDYIGVEVLAAWRYIPSLRWGLVAKIDTSEAFAPVVRLRNIALGIGTIILFLGVVAALLISKSLSAPILALQKGAEIVGRGDLGYRVGTPSPDEIGQLSRAFDLMTESLSTITTELKQKASDLEAANKELESFSYSVSHDLRAPLRHITGFVELLQTEAGGHMDEKGRRYMTTIARSAKKMGLLIDDLLAFSRIGRSDMKMRTVSTEKLVKGAIAELAPEIKDRDITWRIGVLPEVYGDPSLLGLVFVNLIANAVKFTRTRERALIEIGCTRGDNETAFFIRDNGVGFDMKYHEKLFGVFQRLHRQEEFEGTGIGLANVRRIIARHGGRTWAEGSLDRGATFYFALPVNKEEQNAAETHLTG